MLWQADRMMSEKPTKTLSNSSRRRVPLLVRLFYPPKDMADFAKKCILFVIYFWPTLLYFYWY